MFSGDITPCRMAVITLHGLVSPEVWAVGSKVHGSRVCVSLNSRLESNKEEGQGPKLVLPVARFEGEVSLLKRPERILEGLCPPLLHQGEQRIRQPHQVPHLGQGLGFNRWTHRK